MRALSSICATLFSSASLLAYAGTASAQEVPVADSPPASTTSTHDTGLEEIVVTAQRRAENMQRVPIAVTAFSADEAARIGIGNPQAIAQAVPGLVFNRVANAAVPFVRGVGSNSNQLGNEPSVALFVDDVYVATGNGSIFDFNSISSVEVLKGPQGTLFGRNATGGAIVVRTRDPSFETKIDVNAGYANYDTYSGQVYASTGLSNTVAMNIAAYGTKQSDGWGRNITRGEDVFDAYSYGIRAKILIEGDDTRAILGASYDRRHSNQGIALNLVPGTFGRSGYDPVANGVGFYDTSSDGNSFYNTQSYSVNAKITHDFSNARLVSISSFTRNTSPVPVDVDAIAVPFFFSDSGGKVNTATQELQLLSPEGAKVSWILGAFYMHQDTTFMNANLGSIFGGRTATQGPNKQKTDSIAGFAQMSTEILPKLDATIGVRYTIDKRSFFGVSQLGSAVSGPFRDSNTFKNLGGRFSLNYHFTDDVMAYAAYNRGFKSGVFNLTQPAPGAVAPQPAVAPETLDAYTLGFKSEFLDRHVRLNAEAFYYDYKNIQVQTTVTGSTMLTNAGAATIKGVGAELTILPVQRLTINIASAYTDGHYTSFPGGPQFFPLPPNAPIAIPAGCAGSVPVYPPAAGAAPMAQRACDLSGNRTIQTPKFTNSVSVLYTVPTSFGDFDLSGSWAYTGSYYFEPDNDPSSKQKATNIFNASVRWKSSDEKYDVSFWAKNISKEKYYSYFAASSTSGYRYAPAAPRTYGVTLGAHF